MDLFSLTAQGIFLLLTSACVITPFRMSKPTMMLNFAFYHREHYLLTSTSIATTSTSPQFQLYGIYTSHLPVTTRSSDPRRTHNVVGINLQALLLSHRAFPGLSSVVR
jgi:hypothetical protein